MLTSIQDIENFSLQYLFICPREQGRGIGKQFLIRIEEFLRQKGVLKLSGILIDIDHTKQFYLKNGYTYSACLISKDLT